MKAARGLAGVGILALATSLSARAQPTWEVEVVTSFPKRLYSHIEAAFEQRHPHIDIRIIPRKTWDIRDRVTGFRPVDLVWSSSPTPFEELKEAGALAQLAARYRSSASLAGTPITDPDGYYVGFALSGFGLMWHKGFLGTLRVPPPATWDDLLEPRYRGIIGMSAPDRSGTTHVIVEHLLQAKGWRDGWAWLLRLAGNLDTVTGRSKHVPQGVVKQHFAIGLVVDYYGLSASARFPDDIEFIYPEPTTFLPASIALAEKAGNRQGALEFIDFLLGREGQLLLFDPEVRRLPTAHGHYEAAPPGYPNPFAPALALKARLYDRGLARARARLVMALFDELISAGHVELNGVWAALDEADQALSDAPFSEQKHLAQARLTAARQLVSSVPVSVDDTRRAAFIDCFARAKAPRIPSECEVHERRQWRRMTRAAWADALETANAIRARFKP